MAHEPLWYTLSSQILCIYIPRINGGISLFLNAIAVFIIIKKTPTYMDKYQLFLLFMTVLSGIFDFCLTILGTPVPLYGAQGAQYVGFMVYVCPSCGFEMTQLICFLFGLLIFCQTASFAYRHYAYCILRKEQVQRTSIRNFLLFILFLIVLLGCPLSFLQVKSEEREMRVYLDQKQVSVYNNSAFWTIIPSKIDQFHTFLVVATATLFYELAIIVYFVLSIYRGMRLSEQRDTNSTNSVDFHQMLLRALISQTLNPLCFLITPIVLLILSIGAQQALSAENGISTVSLILSMISFCAGSFFSNIHVTTMLYLVLPYRRYIYHYLRLGKILHTVRPQLPCVEISMNQVESPNQNVNPSPSPLPTALMRNI